MHHQVDVIEIVWAGPFTPEGVIQQATQGSDRGIYQIYGTHAICGPETLLYIGKAQNSSFAARISAHQKNWPFAWEPGDMTIYLGRLGSVHVMTRERWSQWDSEIERAEQLLIASTTPPYNSVSINLSWSREPTLVLNCQKRYRLPTAVTSLLYTTSVGTESWQVYGAGENA
jgi:hypothetical protein